MRTTLDIDDDVMKAANELAAARQTTPGKVISELARESLSNQAAEPIIRNGFPQLPRRGAIVTPELVERLLNEDL